MEWISVEDRLPETNVNVLAHTLADHRFVAVMQLVSQHIGEDSPKHNRWYARPSWGHELKVTHWQPLPEPPNE